MHAVAVLNKDSGGMKSLDIEYFENYLKTKFKDFNHSLEVIKVYGSELKETLQKKAKSKNTEILIATGGDGTASLTASLCHEHDKVFGLIPAGTMNLFARTLGIPLDVYEAVDAIADAKIERCDLASANGKIYIHQFSVGMQPKLIEEREKGEYGSKVTKALSGLGATLSILADEDVYQTEVSADNFFDELELSLITVSNNPYGKDHLPFADKLCQNLLGLYWAGPLTGTEKTGLVIDVLSGNWNANEHLKHITSKKVTLHFNDIEPGTKASLDGELIDLAKEVKLEILPAALKALMPKIQT